MPVTTRNKQKFSLPNKEIDSVVVQTNRKKTKVLKAYEESDDLKCNCWGRFGHRSSVHPVYWRTGIEYGYRNNQGWQHSFQTLFSMHNETMNIWTHLIGFFFTFLAIVAYFTNKDVLFSYAYPFIFNATNDFQSNNDLITHSVYGPYYFFSFIISSSICLLGSSMYHLFMCISPALHDRLLFLDVIGIALLVGSSYFPAIYLGFYCFETLKSVYLGMSFAVLTLGLLSTVLEIKLYGNPVRPFVFAGLVLTGLIPCLHWLLIAPPIYRDELYFGIVGLFFWYGLGFVFFLSRFPEVYFTNQYWSTFILSSHTLWHMCILLAIYSWFSYLCAHHEHLETHGCDPYHSPYVPPPLVPRSSV